VERSALVDDAEQVRALTHPTRLLVLDALRDPDSAAGVARRLGEPRQRVNHHVRELAKAGLIVDAGERRKGNFVEQLYVAAAGTFVVSPRVAWGDRERLRAATDQASLAHLVSFGETLARDAAALLDRAAFDGEEIPSAAVRATVRLPDARARAEFLDEYLEIVRDLIERHARPDGPEFTVGLVVHPTTEEQR
jgi:DNA-binding transcriptional ArsR family regulator